MNATMQVKEQAARSLELLAADYVLTASESPHRPLQERLKGLSCSSYQARKHVHFSTQ